MIENRLEKKFIYNEGDFSHKFFILNSMFKKISILKKREKVVIFLTKTNETIGRFLW